MSIRLSLLPQVAFDGKPVTSAAISRLIASLAADLRVGVGSGRLIDDLWPDERPGHPTKALQVVVSRARTALGADVIESTASGYRLNLAEDEVDVAVLRSRTAAAQRARRDGDAAAALGHADAGLALWPDAGSATGSGDPLAMLRADALTVRAQLCRERGLALGGLGRHADAREALAPYLEHSPHDEEVLAAVLRADAATGARSTALERYEAYRRSLRDQLGTDPGPELQRIQRELLDDDRPQVRAGVQHDPNPLLGRDHDIDAVVALLGTSRVVSIIGPGGLGKTRLAHAVSRRALQRTVQFVGLAGVTDSSEVIPEVATALGVTSARTRTARTTEAPIDLATAITRSLGVGSALLVLDNCEHVLDGAVELARSLVAVLPELRILTTSRAPLGLSSETVYPLAELDTLTSVQLFTERARAVRPDIELPEQPVQRLCARLDGLPLALELAAARTNVLSVEQIEQRLEHRFALLNRGARDAPDRHRTLQAVIDWSWRLLGPAEQAALATLSTFADGFDLDAAGEVLTATGAASAVDPIDVVEHLVDQSLLQRADRGGRPRFRMLETVREFGADRLRRTGGTDDAIRAVMQWAAAVARTHGPLLFGLEPDPSLAYLLAEEDNLTAALRSAVDADDPAAAAALFGALGSLWSVQSRHEQVFGPAADIVRLISHYRPEPDALEITRQALVISSVNLNIVGSATGLRGLGLLRRLPLATTPGIIEAFSRLISTEGAGPYLDADRALVLAETADPMLRVAATLLASHVLENDGRVTEALEMARSAVHQPALAESVWATVVNQTRVAELAASTGDYAEAEATGERALPLLERFGARGDITSMRWMLAMLRLHRDDVTGAAEQLQLAGQQPSDDSFGEGTTGLAIHAALALAEGNVDAGLRRFRAAVEHAETRSKHAPFIGDETTVPWMTVARASSLIAHATHDRLCDVEELPDRLAASLRDLASLEETGPLSLVLRVDLPVCGCAVLGLSYYLARSATTDELRAHAARGVALSSALGISRTAPSFALGPAEALAIQTDEPAYASAQEMYAGTGRDELLGLLGQWVDALPDQS